MRTHLAARTAAVIAALGIALSACSISTEDPAGAGDTAPSADATSEPDETTSEETTDSAPTDAPTSDVLPANRTWLYEVSSDANFNSGGQISVAVAGGDGSEHADSTSRWLGCDGVAAVTTYALDGGYSALYGILAFRDGTPAGLLAQVQIETDLGVLGAYQVDSDGGVPLQLLLDGATTLTVTAAVSAGSCGRDDVGYLVFADTYLT